MVIKVKSRKKQNISMVNGKGATSQDSGLLRDLLYLLKKLEDNWINQGRREYNSVTSEVIQVLVICHVFTLYTSNSASFLGLKTVIGYPAQAVPDWLK